MTPVDVRYAIDPNTSKGLDTDGLRDNFHVDGLFQPGAKLVYSHYDRMIVGSVVASEGPVTLDEVENTGTASFLERREMGILNIGGEGKITVGGETYEPAKGEVLYIGMGAGPVTFEGDAKFYFLCVPAHRAIATRLIKLADAKRVELGSKEQANERVIIQFLHPDVQETCQLTMGYTQFLPGSLWNTMPAHIHDRRMEAYMYFDLDEGSRVFHFMGEPSETRHIVMSNEEAVISPPWSIHSGAGTGAYTFCWAMAGDNTDFTDMDFIAMEDLR